MLKDLLLKNRSYRRFDQQQRISDAVLRELVALLPLCPSARNAQPLKYYAVTDEQLCAGVFDTLAWAGYLTNWAGPVEGERPAAYLVQVLDTRISENCLCDDGIQVQTLLLGAVEKGYGGCIIKAFKSDLLRGVLKMEEYLKPMYVIALGKPVEKVVLDEIRDNDCKYWREADGTHHVPKRPADDLMIN